MEDSARQSAEDELLSLTRELIGGIAQWDYKTYERLCAENMTCFQPEAAGNCVEGLGFHKWYFDMFKDPKAVASNQTLTAPKVRMLGKDAAVVTYVRLQQGFKNGKPRTKVSEETRVWEKRDGTWKNVHFHISTPTIPSTPVLAAIQSGN